MKGKILIVDDEPQIRSMMDEWLTYAGYESFTACDGEEGLISLLKEQPDVAVSDVWMPNMDGYEFCRLAREGSDAAIVLMSGVSSEIEVLKSKDMGSDLVLTKPFGMGEFLEVIGDLMEKRTSQSSPTDITERS